jgi:hypothetical protein
VYLVRRHTVQPNPGTDAETDAEADSAADPRSDTAAAGVLVAGLLL